MLTQTQQDIIALVKRSKQILILPSAPIDGDSLGSALSLYLVLKKLGKKVTVVAEDAVPASYSFLPEIGSIHRELHFMRDLIVTIDCREDAQAAKVRHEIQGNKINIILTPNSNPLTKDHVSFSEGPIPYDCIICVDAGGVEQFGKLYESSTELFSMAPVINIDHHASNTGFGRINLVDIMAPSTTTILLPLIEALGAPDATTETQQILMDADIATLLLAGLITDTGSFQNANTTPDAFAIAAKLIEYGARQQEIIRHIYKTKKLSTLRLWGRTLSKIQYDEKHKMVWSVLTAKDFADIGSTPDETEGVIDELMSNAPGAEIVFLIKEKGPTEVSGSIRTLSPTIDGSKIAELLGGGGHVQAAGFKLHDKNIEEGSTYIVDTIRTFQKQRLGFVEAAAAPIAPVAPAPVATPAPAPVQVAVAPVAAPAAPVAPVVPSPTPAIVSPVISVPGDTHSQQITQNATPVLPQTPPVAPPAAPVAPRINPALVLTAPEAPRPPMPAPAPVPQPSPVVAQAPIVSPVMQPIIPTPPPPPVI